MSEEITATQQSLADLEAKGKQGQLQEAVAELVKSLPRGTHLTAPEVYRRAKEQGLKISLSTVYRTLNALQAHGNVTTLAGEHGKRYEARDHDHDHLICVKCGLTIEFTDELIKGFGKAVAERKGYEHKSSRFDILGVCADCRAKDNDHKIGTTVAAVENVIALTSEAVACLEGTLSHLEARKLAKAHEGITSAIGPLRDALDELMQSLEIIVPGDGA